MGKPLLSLEAEIVNSITHALGILFGFIFIPLLISHSAHQGTTAQLIGVGIYGFCYVSTFTLSTLYHASKRQRLKKRLELLDHISIYFLIAATYTPFVVHYMKNSTGVVFLAVVWFMVLTGIVYKLFYLNKFILMSVFSYICMSFVFLFFRKSFFENMPPDVISFLYSGIVLYLLGVIFFLWQKLKHHHALRHLFVLAGSICHYQAVWLSVHL